MLFETFIGIITLISMALVVYHHVGYPLILMISRKNQVAGENAGELESEIDKIAEEDLPRLTIVVPAYNEEKYIADKVRNLAMLDYPKDKLHCIIACDGCSDGTATVARRTMLEPFCSDLSLEVKDFEINRGKVAVINDVVSTLDTDVVGLSDVSALLSVDALVQGVSRLAQPDVGVVTGTYRLLEALDEGEKKYWNYQTNIKLGESALGSTLGAHGAFYLFHAELFETLPEDTINDDFILPMSIVAKGFKTAYEPSINALELERTAPEQEVDRRQRISAGNLQQLIRLRGLLNPQLGSVAFMFASGKGLRVLMPWLMMIAFFGSLALASTHLFFALSAIGQLFLYGMSLSVHFSDVERCPKAFQTLYYLVQGHVSSLIGGINYVTGNYEWKNRRQYKGDTGFVPMVQVCKRSFDVLVSLSILTIASPIMLLVAAAIKLEDKSGPVLFRQQRIGRVTADQVPFFDMIKFRTMVTDAEKMTGAVWASKNDPRITRVGNFLRKTRLDELPQLINVLKGEMSLVGPRPERPDFYAKLEREIPFFAERTFGVTPGITGLAQVNQGYDTCIEDVRSKVGYDHRYSFSLATFGGWLKMDLYVLFKTVSVMVLGRGQ